MYKERKENTEIRKPRIELIEVVGRCNDLMGMELNEYILKCKIDGKIEVELNSPMENTTFIDEVQKVYSPDLYDYSRFDNYYNWGTPKQRFL